MIEIVVRRVLSVSVVVGAALAAGTASAQAPAVPAEATMAGLLHEMDDMRQELEYLRERDARRNPWESSVTNSPPDIGYQMSTVSYRAGVGGCECCDSACDGCGATSCSSCGCGSGCGGLYGCLCPLPEAPCIECPRVSTVNPYFNVHVFGALKLDMIFSSARAISPGTPFFLLPGSLPGFNEDTVSVHARQSTLGAAFTGPRFAGCQSGGQLIVMFFNDSVIADQYGVLPLQAFGELRNQNWRFAAGLQFDVFSPGIPTVLPFSALAASGNAGNSFRGQLRLERFLYPSSDAQWTIQFALSEPVSSTIDPTFRVLEDNGWPNVEGRIALGLGCLEGAGPTAKRPLEIGVSGVVGQLRTTEPLVRQVVADVWGLGADFRWKMTDCFGVMGEVYTGEALGTYNGGILQNISVDGIPATFDTLEGIRSSGGWMEVFYYWTPCLHSHVGYGLDDPTDRDVALTGRTWNSTLYSNLIWDLNKTFRVGFELTWRETDYKGLPDNEGAGFHTQFQWAF